MILVYNTIIKNKMANNHQTKNNSLILNLESLTKQYDTLLIQYNQVQSDYLNYLQQNPTTIQPGQSNSQLTVVQNSTFWGTSGISSSNVSSVDQCSALCSRTPGCSGATYSITNNTQNNCWLRSGDGVVVAGSNKQYAIIPKSKEYLLTLQTLNSQLIDTNKNIMKVFHQCESIPEQDIERVKKYNLLKQNNMKLEKERLNILNKLKYHQTIEEKKIEGELIVKKNYSNYILLSFIVLVCFLILSKTVIDSVNQNTAAYNSNSVLYIILACLIAILIISYFYRLFR